MFVKKNLCLYPKIKENKKIYEIGLFVVYSLINSSMLKYSKV